MLLFSIRVLQLTINVFRTVCLLSRQKRPQTDEILTSGKKPKVLASPEASGPEKAADSDLKKQKEEKKENQICRQMEHSDSEGAARDPEESHAEVTNTTTQTDLRVKLENLSQPVMDAMPSTEPPLTSYPHQNINEESMQNSMAPLPPALPPSRPSHGGEDGRPSKARSSVNPFVSEIQQLRGQVEKVTKERDSLQQQVHVLSRQLREAQARFQALSQSAVEQQRSSAAEEGLDYKSLFEKAQRRVDELLKEKEALQAAAESKLTQVQCKEEDEDEASMQIGCLLMELDDYKTKRNELLSEVRHLRFCPFFQYRILSTMNQCKVKFNLHLNIHSCSSIVHF